MAGETTYSELPSFGARADKKFVRRKTVVLQGDTTGGGTWATITSDKYDVDALLGWIEQRAMDDSNNPIDWNYFDYRASYTYVDAAGTPHIIANDPVDFVDYDEEILPEGENGEVTGGALYDLFLEGGISASWGDVGGWYMSDNTLYSGNVVLDSNLEQIRLGAGVGFGTGTGVALGKSGGVYQFYAGTAGNYVYWNGTTLSIVGVIAATSGSIGGWTINTNYLAKDTGTNATSAGLAPLDYPFYAGATYANRASAPFRVNPQGQVWATTFFTIGSNDLVFNNATDALVWLKGISFDRLDVNTTGAFNLDTQGRSWIRLTGTAAKKTISYIKKPSNIAGQIIYIKNDATPITVHKTSPLVLRNNQPSPPANYAAMSLFGSDYTLKNFGMVTLIYDSANETWTLAGSVKATATKKAGSTSALADEGYDEGLSIESALPTGISATAGTEIQTKAAGTLAVDMDVPASGTWTMELVTPSDGTTWMFANSENAYMQQGAAAIYFTVVRGTNDGETQTYTCTFVSGTRPQSFYAGQGVANYGASGQGWIYSTVASGLPYMSVRTHAGTPTSFTERVRLGSLTGITDAYFGALSGYGLWTSNVYLTGSINATSGLIGGWGIIASSFAYDTGTNATSAGMSPSDYPFYAGATYANRATAAFRVTPAGAVTMSSATITGGTITTNALNVALYGWSTNIAFTSASATQVNWAAGSIRVQNGTTYSIGAGNTGAMAALTYIYLDTAVSTTALQTTTTYSTATGDGKILIAVAQNHASNGASVLVYGGGQPIINGGDQITASSILAANIAAGTITSNEITGTTLSAIRADMGSITAGTITGAVIRTAASGARTEMNYNNLFGLGFGGVGGIDGSAVVQWYAKATDGKIYFGGGNQVLDANGYQIVAGAAYGTTRAIRWMSAIGGFEILRMYGWRDTLDPKQRGYIQLQGNGTDDAYLELGAYSGSDAELWLGTGSGSSISVYQGTYGGLTDFILLRAGALGAGAGVFSLGSFKFWTDATYDIGGAAANRPQDVHVARNVNVGNNLDVASTGQYRFNGIKVMGARQTGWNNPSGTLLRGTFNSGTATLVQTAQTLAALITDLRAHGMINT